MLEGANVMVKRKLSLKYIEDVILRNEAATPGPWIDYLEGRDHTSGESFIARGINRSEKDLSLIGGSDADIEFIAHAKQDIPVLINEIKRLYSLLGLENEDSVEE
jgi:hypothetical protein